MLTDKEISTLCMQRHREADTYTTSLQKQRENSLKYYNCELFGDEKEGQSTFITSDVRDTIEWMLPQMVEMFIGPEAFEFSAKNAQDVESAKLETAYVNHIYNEINPGFLNTYTWLKDGLLLKNGVAKAFWDEKVDEIEETYEGKDFTALQALIIDPQIEIKEVTAKIGEDEFSFDELPPELQPLALYDVNAVRKEDNSKVCVKIIPPENFTVEKGHNSLDLQSVGFCCHRDVVTASDLIVDGYDKALVDSIPSGDDSDLDSEKISRFGEESPLVGGYEDKSSRPITVYECYIRADFTGNGKSELWLVKLAGSDGSIFLDKETVDSIPFMAWTPVINCHKFYGLSYADLVMDLQKLRSTLMRQMLNNIYMVNHPAKTILENQVYKEDLLQTGPGAIWRVKQQDAIQTHVTPFVGEATIPVLSMVEEMRQERTGVSQASQGLDPSALSDSTNLVGGMIMTQAMQRIKMVARIFAETGFKDAMIKIHELCSKHGKQDEFETDGQWQSINPREWAKRTRYKVKVGVGYVDKIQRVQAIGVIIQNQKEIALSAGLESSLTGADNLYQALVEQAKLLGYMDGAKFYRDPSTYQQPESQPSEAIQITEATTVAELTKSKASNDVEMAKHKDDSALKKYEIDLKAVLEREKMEQDKQLKREEMLLRYGTTRGSSVGFEANHTA